MDVPAFLAEPLLLLGLRCLVAAASKDSSILSYLFDDPSFFSEDYVFDKNENYSTTELSDTYVDVWIVTNLTRAPRHAKTIFLGFYFSKFKSD